MSLSRELSLALSYGRNSKALSSEKVRELSEIEILIADAPTEAELVNRVKRWAEVVTQ